MIKKFIERFEASKPKLEAKFREKCPEHYAALLRLVVELLDSEDDEYKSKMDPERIHKIDDGNYQGTLLFLIGSDGYQPEDYWYVKVGYGSCSGCDTLESIRRYSDEGANDEQVKGYMTLALHIVQGLHKLGEEDAA